MAQIRSARSKRASSLAAKRRLLIAVVTCILGVFAFAYFRVISNLDGTNNEIRAAEQEQRSHSAQQSDEIANELVPAIPSVVEPLPQVTTKHTKQQVVCGAHKADTCEECPQGNGQGWCNGECAWCHQTDTCMPKTTLCTQCGRKGTGVFDCEAISQECLWCEERSDCIAANDFCTNSSVVCGEHSAPTCRQCPQGDGEIDCSGECAWCKPLGVCMMKATGCTATCELREKITCEDVSHKCSWCNNKSKCLPADKYCPRPLVWKPAEKESWFVEPTKSYDLTLSVILPCGHEYLFFERTIWSILDSTPADVLHEIIIVDDNSDPPLESIAEKTYAEVKYVRSNETLGLIKAKHVGSEVATGDIIVFFDCHVKPAQGWWEPMVREISDNPRRVVVPTISSLNVRTWEEFARPKAGNGGINSKCYLTLAADFVWTSDDTRWVPIMSGGLLAIKRSWFFEIGGHDQEMKGWGGENIDLSLRIWRCGGEIVYSEESFVAHMFRDNKNKETKAIYKIPANSAPRNRARAMKAHAGIYYENKTRIFKEFQNIRGINTSSIDQALEKLQCKDFFWYLEKFLHIYRDAAVIPKEVFQITPDGGKSCLALQDTAPWGHPVTNEKLVTESCDVHDGFSATEGRQFFHLGARNAEGKCCSGIRLWNTKSCLAAKMTAKWCFLDSGRGQQAEFTPEGYLKVEGQCWDHRNNTLSEAECSEMSTQWARWRPFVPEEYNLLTSELKAIW